ncbi:DJ-1/PfpI family protein [Mycobacteroides immunogenum]|uniref:DJ-1/PfpI domain-containing protein n=1 Tax=Mycobacteroides immunogenum TaxID=83262 RepID=A0A7V8RVG5_9MYCO|nr:DJ-1/PfpI family protein [Mycobacteroides immunogenum]AMT72651.1 hypothetical protein ABG82_22695 [Mycobacteroides immunogenum]ANO05814.1 hypothetical protein BAB75_22975 [Mycobacteroides immunogenum]KIU41030.1 hypothetical protein TL11_08085 [Mycobacteroides immunogenum]KPG05936.1 hypothetical protein AN909_19395 [Mycobacteroides immunogenum]KPG07582.1 hypothetical protein AN908_18875 [Mycobacteroides immunogenum]
MASRIAHVAVYNGLAESEIGHLLVELRSGRFTRSEMRVVTVAVSRMPVTTMGGLRLLPDLALSELDAAASDLLILGGAQMWDSGGGDEFISAARCFLEQGVPVAAICGATAGMARGGLLDERDHTSAAPDYLAATGYRGGAHYLDERAVLDGDLITAGPQSPVQFASAVLRRLGLASEATLAAYEALFDRAELAAFATLAGMRPEAR